MKTRKYGKSNHRKLLKMADQLAIEVQNLPQFKAYIPTWAGLAWIIDTFYNYQARNVAETMGETWMARARRICKGLAR